jgi:streptogramin lyase
MTPSSVRLKLLAVLVVALVLVVAAVVFIRNSGTGRSAQAPASSAGTTSDSEDVTAAAPDVVAKFNLPADSETPVFTAGATWISTWSGQLTRVDAEKNTSEVVRKGQPWDGREGGSAMSAFGSIWFWEQGRGVFRLDPDTGTVTARIPEDIELRSTGFGSLWGLDVGHKVFRIDPKTNKVVARLRVSDNETETYATGCVEPFRASCPDYLTVHKDRVVVFIDGEDAAVHIDPATNRVTKRVKMPASSSGFYRLYGEVPWVMTESGLAQVDLDSGEVLAQVPLREDQRALWAPALRHAIAINGDTAWLVANYTTTEIDLKHARVVETFDTPGSGGVLGASFGHGDLWVSYAGGTVRRLDLPGA